MRQLNRKQISTLLLSILLVFVAGSCSEDTSSDEDLGNWVQSPYYEGQPRSGSVSFVIGDKAYVGLGYDGDDYFTDFFAYDPERGVWDDVAEFPGDARERAVAFSLNGKGYVGLGYNRDLDTEELKDFWEYDPQTDTWTPIANFSGTARYNAVAFSIGDLGYVGTGYDGNYYRSDFFSYNPDNNTWTEVANFPGGKREEAVAVVHEDKAYFCTGRNNGIYAADIWVFDPNATKVWNEVTPDDDEDYYDEFATAVKRHDACAFVLHDRIYITTGSTGSATQSVYEFNPVSGYWDSKTAFEGSERYRGVAFTINNRAFVGLGQNSSRRWDDFWEFFPEDEYEDAD
jgi:N-acetylneuraminic acid mutarotase